MMMHHDDEGAMDAIAVHCRSLPPIAVYCRPLLSIAVHCRPLLSVAMDGNGRQWTAMDGNGQKRLLEKDEKGLHEMASNLQVSNTLTGVEYPYRCSTVNRVHRITQIRNS